MFLHFKIAIFFISLFFPLSLSLANTCTSFFPLESSISNASFLQHTIILPQILLAEGYTPGDEYMFTIQTIGSAKINTFFLQVITQDSTPIGTFLSDNPRQSVITCQNPNDSLIDPNLSADQNLTYLRVIWVAPDVVELSASLSLVFILGVSRVRYREFNSQIFSLKDFCSPSPCQNSGSCQPLLTGGYSCICQLDYFGSNCQHFNACISSPCLNNGMCSDQLYGFLCDCPSGYTGRQCEVDLDECQLASLNEGNPCMFNGDCIDGSNAFSCECDRGYTGDRCDVNLQDCTTGLCGDTGLCVDLVGDYMCSCNEGTAGRNCELSHDCSADENICLNNAVCNKNTTFDEISCVCHSGFSGPTCTTAVDHCTSDTCQNDGTCHNLIDIHLCECSPGWVGSNCEVNVNECQTPDICNNGICVDNTGSFYCFCANGFAGRFCESNIPDCFESLCDEFSFCMDGIGDYTCICPPGRTGRFCDTNLDLCLSNPCRNNATCADGIFSHSCTCLASYTGDNCGTEIDECEDSPCLNNGTCIDKVNEFLCLCRDGFTGACCEINIDECEPQPCENDGVCIDGVNSFTCDCTPAFTNITCSEDVDECSQPICLNNSTCSNSYGGFSCACESGFTGDLCGNDIDECLIQPCLNGGDCVNTVGNYSCICPASYKGDICQTFVPSCDMYDEQGNSLDCENNGTCIESENSIICQCTPGYTGQFCETIFDPCLNATCSSNSTCMPLGFNYTCICPPGVTGFDCNTDVMECRNNICDNNGTCMELFGSFRCICGELFEGQRCEIALNICELSRPCSNNGTCESTQLGTPIFNCTCPLGFTGDLCEIQIDYCESNPCFNNATCMTAIPPIFSKTPLFTCTCQQGYTGITCADDINECLFVPCRNNATCVNQPGNYSCECLAGYTGDRCGEEILECQILTPCQNNGTCIEMIGGYVCECIPGYTGENCTERIDFCMDSPCNNGTCVSLNDNYMCICPQGVTGPNCATDIPECALQPCINDGMCQESFGSFSCICLSGFTGTFCEEELDNCSPNPCMNEGLCMDSTDSFECFCRLGYTGNLCHVNINDCANSPCLNGGTCTDGVASFSCACTSGYTGSLCSIDIDSCQSSPCANNGTCIDLPRDDGYMCQCAIGYTGLDCDEEIDECANTNCSGNGQCFDYVGGYDCVCNTGYSGSDCENRIDMCSSSPCVNGGICLEDFPFFECNCLVGFTGELCQTDIDECMSNPCRNGSICVDGLNGFMCLCTDPYTGPTCDTELLECASYPCLNNGTCLEIQGTGFVCICTVGYTGDICENQIDFCVSESYMNDPCVNGSCISIRDRFICMCNEGYTGARCENQLPSICVAQGTNPCNNGTCIASADVEEGFTCTCLQGYTGGRCENEINECNTSQGISQCVNGNCIDLIGDFYCICTSGYTGRQCDMLVDDCTPDPCQNGVCRTVNGQFVCLCYDGYSGDLCQVEIDECESSPCQNDGTCLDRVNNTVCICQPGYTGKYCQFYLPMCTVDTCMNGGECIEDVVEGFRCICPVGLTGRTCDMILSFCKEDSCLNGGVCVDVVNGFECVCTTGYTGQRCDNILDFCESMPCSNNATCISANTNFSCICIGDYIGDLCQYYDNCAAFDCNNGVCVNLFNSTSRPITSVTDLIGDGLISCVCESGYSGELCDELIDICAQNNDTCSNRGTCITTGDGLYRCECDLGYAGNNCQTAVSSVYFTQSSYLELASIPNALNQYTIELSIQTNDSSALLLYTAQDSSQNRQFFDFLLVQLISGQIRVTFDCGSGPGTAQTNFNIDDGQVHIISIVREGQSIELTVDGRVYRDMSPGENTQQILTLPLFIGGLSDYSILPTRFRALTGYTGCVHFVTVSSQIISLTRDYINAIGIQTCQESSCDYVQCENGGQCNDDLDSFFLCICPEGYRGTYCEVLSTSCRSVEGTGQLANDDMEIVCYNGGDCKQIGNRFMCVCLLGFTGDNCQQVILIDTPYFSGEDSYLIFTSFIDLSLTFNISIHFRPLSPNGVILYSSQFATPPIGDYTILQLYDGYIEFIFDCGSGALTLTSPDKLVLNSWHRVRVVRMGRVGHLYVDSQLVQSGSSFGIFARLNLADNLYLGGFDSKVITLPPVIQNNTGLIGCIEEFNSSPISIMLSQATGGRAINSCPVSLCNSSYCYNDGICLEDLSTMLIEVSCSCQQGYSGDRCQNVIDMCLTDNPCQAGGICQSTDEGNYFICRCPLGRDGLTCENEISPILPKLTTSQSFLQYSLLPHIPLDIWNKIVFSFTFDFSVISEAESQLRSLLYFGSVDSNDFIALILDFFEETNPSLQLQYNIGSGIHIAIGPSIQQDILYTVSLTRYRQLFTLTTRSDTAGDTMLESYNTGPDTALNLPIVSAVIVIGALSQQLQSRITLSADITSVRGCMHTLNVNTFDYGVITSADRGLSISDCLQDICYNSQPCMNDGICIQNEHTSIVCLCGLGFIGDNCAQAISISTASFLSYSSLTFYPIPGPITEKLIISLPIKLDTLSGKLLLIANELETEFIRLELIHGVFLLNSHLGDARTIQPLLPSRWYNLTIVITTEQISALIDGELYLESLSYYTVQFITTDTLEVFTVGSSMLSQQSFQGCIGNITITYDGVMFILSPSTAREGRGISQCVFSSQCSSSVCSDHGVCSLNDDLSYNCVCYDGFSGSTCDVALLECDNSQVGCVNGGTCKAELVDGKQVFSCICQLPYTGDKCQYRSTFTSVYFNTNSYLGFPSSFLSGFRASTIIELVVMPDSGDGVLFFAQNIQGTSRQDYIYIGLRNYKVEFRFDLGTGSRTLVSRQSIQLGNPISIRALRNEQSGQLFIDNKLEASGDSPGSSSFFALNTDIYLGGVPFDHLVSPFGSAQGFQGCIGSFQVGYQTSTIPVSFTSATSGINIRQC